MLYRQAANEPTQWLLLNSAWACQRSELVRTVPKNCQRSFVLHTRVKKIVPKKNLRCSHTAGKKLTFNLQQSLTYRPSPGAKTFWNPLSFVLSRMVSCFTRPLASFHVQIICHLWFNLSYSNSASLSDVNHVLDEQEHIINTIHKKTIFFITNTLTENNYYMSKLNS